MAEELFQRLLTARTTIKYYTAYHKTTWNDLGNEVRIL